MVDCELCTAAAIVRVLVVRKLSISRSLQSTARNIGGFDSFKFEYRSSYSHIASAALPPAAPNVRYISAYSPSVYSLIVPRDMAPEIDPVRLHV